MVHRRVAAENRGWLIAAYGSPNGAASQTFAMAVRQALADALAAALAALGLFHGLPILPPRVARFRRHRPLPCLRARAKPDNVHTRIYIYIYTCLRASIHTASPTIMLAFRRMHLCICVCTHAASQSRSPLPRAALPCPSGVFASSCCSRTGPDTWRHSGRNCSGPRRSP